MGAGRRPMPWLYIGLTLVALLFIILSALAPKSYPDYSTYSPAPNGTKALFLLLERLKYPVSRIKQDIPAQGSGLMVMIEAEVLSKKEAKKLVDWVKKGNNLFVINSKPDELSKTLKLTWIENPREQKLKVKPDEKYFKNVTFLMLSQGQRIKPKAPDLESAYEDKFGAYLAVLKKGQGRILYLTDSAMATNRKINLQDNGVFLMNILNNNLPASTSNRLWVNEWVHGYTSNSEVREVLSWPIRLAVIQLLLGLVVLFHYWGKRFSKPIPVPQTGGGLTGEMVSSLANIYRQGRARNLVLTNTYQSFRLSLTQYLGVPAQTANAKIVSVFAQRPHVDAASLERLIKRIEKELQGKNINESELLNLVRQMEVWRLDNLTSLQERRNRDDGK